MKPYDPNAIELQASLARPATTVSSRTMAFRRLDLSLFGELVDEGYFYSCRRHIIGAEEYIALIS
jgi:hypothetical protein